MLRVICPYDSWYYHNTHQNSIFRELTFWKPCDLPGSQIPWGEDVWEQTCKEGGGGGQERRQWQNRRPSVMFIFILLHTFQVLTIFQTLLSVYMDCLYSLCINPWRLGMFSCHFLLRLQSLHCQQMSKWLRKKAVENWGSCQCISPCFTNFTPQYWPSWYFSDVYSYFLYFVHNL